jgi:AhpD family alkylhydroperoxidase
MTSSANQLKPMFLLGVEDNPKPSPYLDAINSAKAAGAEHWQIWSLLAFNPEAADHLARFSHTIMHQPGPISPALRELIAAYTSFLNNCEFCMKAHAAVAGHLYEDEEFIWSVLRDPESSKLRATGWDDAAIYYAITATALFNFYNRWISASGVHPVSDETFRLYSRRMADHGYIRESPKT